jgi:HEPN domain-containing protein
LKIFREFARRYFEEAVKDLARAERAVEFSDWPQAVFYAQQCVEKAVKAMLELKMRVVYNHGPQLILAFTEAFRSEWRQEFNEIVEALEYLQEYYTRARYPVLFRGRVYSPEEMVTRDVAVKAIGMARRVLSIVRAYLAQQGIAEGEGGS